jgi:hypothetical protein
MAFVQQLNSGAVGDRDAGANVLRNHNGGGNQAEKDHDRRTEKRFCPHRIDPSSRKPRSERRNYAKWGLIYPVTYFTGQTLL